MSTEQILTLLALGAIVIIEAFRYLENRKTKSVEESFKTFRSDMEKVLSDFNDTVVEISSGLRDSIPQETFADLLKWLDTYQESHKEGLLKEFSELVENAVKRIDHDSSNDPVKE